MAYETGSATDPVNLLSKLNTFAAANGWTVDYFDDPTGRLSLHRNSVYAHFLADTGDPLIMCSQSLGFINSGTNYYAHTDDAGGNFDSSTPFSEDTKSINLFNTGPYVKYWFFESHSAESYIHVVVRVAATRYVIFSFGEIEKFGTWTGGEYLAHNNLQDSDSTLGSQHYRPFLWDGAQLSALDNASTIHVEGMPGQLAAGKWASIIRTTEDDTLDRAGEARNVVLGGVRGGFMEASLGPTTTTQGGVFTPLRPITLFYLDTTVSNNAHLIGYAPDVKTINIGRFNAGVENDLGGDTWVTFPYWDNGLQSDGDQYSGEGGIAFKKIV